MAAEIVSPELVLVCPDLRTAALADLPQREPDAWLDRSRPRASASSEFGLVAALTVEEAPADERGAPLPLALFAYAAASATRFALEATLFIGIVIGLLSVVTLVHP